MNNPNEHENTPSAELVEQLVSLAVESCFHPSEESTRRLISTKIAILTRMGDAQIAKSWKPNGDASLKPVPMPAGDPAQPIPEGLPTVEFSSPSHAEVKSTTFPEEPTGGKYVNCDTCPEPEAPKPAKRERSKS